MVFNSFEFIGFIVIVYSLYLMMQHRLQNRLLLAASYIFYGFWDWRFLSLIFASTVIDYFCGLKVYEEKEIWRKKLFVLISVCVNLGILAFFKYFNFFTKNFQLLVSKFGFPIEPLYLNIILPLGISFYTFQTMSYTIDIYRRELKPARNFFDFALFVSFFPQLVAGPIERAKHLLPQILKPRKVTGDTFYQGTFLIFWGLFQKVFIADNLAKIVDPVFAVSGPYNGQEVLLALYAFTFQIYCDFAGYSNCARGLGKIMGFDIMINFNLPFFVTNIQDFWNKWHISLSSWIRDYLYIPLIRGLRGVKGNFRLYLALLISMTLIGLWHGASYNFVIFGAYYGILLVLYVVIRGRCYNWIQPKSEWGRKAWVAARMIFMFHLICIGMLIFRVNFAAQIGWMIKGLIFNFKPFEGMTYMIIQFLFFTWILFLVQLAQYRRKDLMCVYNSNILVKTAFYFATILLMVSFGVSGGDAYIYFQF